MKSLKEHINSSISEHEDENTCQRHGRHNGSQEGSPIVLKTGQGRQTAGWTQRPRIDTHCMGVGGEGGGGGVSGRLETVDPSWIFVFKQGQQIAFTVVYYLGALEPIDHF